MKKQEYKFSCGPSYSDIDFKRIVDENSEFSFIRVSWIRETGIEEVIYMVTEKGYERCKNAEVTDYLHNDGTEMDLIVKRDGILVASSTDDSGFSVRLFGSFSGAADVRFKEFYARLQEREVRKRQIKVITID